MQDALLIVEPNVHLEMLLGILSGTLEANPATKVDAARTIKSKPERFLAVLGQLVDSSKDATVPHSVSGHLSYTALLLVETGNVENCVHVFSGMELCQRQTKSTDHVLLVVSGDVKHWTLALASPLATTSVRRLLSLLKNQFISLGLTRLFNDEQLRLLP